MHYLGGYSIAESINMKHFMDLFTFMREREVRRSHYDFSYYLTDNTLLRKKQILAVFSKRNLPAVQN